MTGNTPMPGNGQAPANASVTKQPTFVQGNVTPNQELKITITSGASPNNSGANILILQSMVPYKVISLLSAAVPDQSNVTLSSSVSAGNANGLADWNRWVQNQGLTVSYIRIYTSDTTLYAGNLNYGIIPFVGSTQPAWWPLPNYAKNGSSGYAKDLLINTMPDGSAMNWAITKNTYLYFDTLPASSTIYVYLGISGTGEYAIAS